MKTEHSGHVVVLLLSSAGMPTPGVTLSPAAWEPIAGKLQFVTKPDRCYVLFSVQTYIFSC